MLWLVLGVLALVVNTLVGSNRLAEQLSDPGNRLAFAFGQAAFLSILVCGLSALSAKKRNFTYMGKALFWTQVITFLFVVLRS